MNVPFCGSRDDTTPYPADFERVGGVCSRMGYALDIVEEGRAGGDLRRRVPFLNCRLMRQAFPVDSCPVRAGDSGGDRQACNVRGGRWRS